MRDRQVVDESEELVPPPKRVWVACCQICGNPIVAEVRPCPGGIDNFTTGCDQCDDAGRADDDKIVYAPYVLDPTARVRKQGRRR